MCFIDAIKRRQLAVKVVELPRGYHVIDACRPRLSAAVVFNGPPLVYSAHMN